MKQLINHVSLFYIHKNTGYILTKYVLMMLILGLKRNGRLKGLRHTVFYFKIPLRGDLFLCHVTGAQKHNLLCFAVGGLI